MHTSKVNLEGELVIMMVPVPITQLGPNAGIVVEQIGLAIDENFKPLKLSNLVTTKGQKTYRNEQGEERIPTEIGYAILKALDWIAPDPVSGGIKPNVPKNSYLKITIENKTVLDE